MKSDSRAYDGGFPEAQLEGRRLRHSWEKGRRSEVIDSLKYAKAGPWFVAMTVASMCDGMTAGEREQLLRYMFVSGSKD
jgi:hypothetical protein